MCQAVADSVRHLPTLAVNGAYEFAPWATGLCANDSAWWRAHPAAIEFAGRKFCTSRVQGVERILPDRSVSTSSCSGVLALEVAKRLGATRIILLGADFHGTHYCGPYPEPLRNTTEERRMQHAVQFSRWAKANPKITVVNCTAGSRLKAFPMGRMEDFKS